MAGVGVRGPLRPGVNDLATVYPQVADQYAGDPTQQLANTLHVMSWRCPNHPEPFPQRLEHRLKGHGCGYCNNTRLLPGFNDLATRRPDLAATLVDADPTTVIAASNRTEYLWRCPQHQAPFRQQLASRLRGDGCGVCRGLQVVPGLNDLATTHPDLAAQLVDVDPTTVFAGGTRVYQWRCPNHAEPFEQAMSSRLAGYGCGICTGKQVLPGFNDMATTHPQLAAELVDTDPTTVRATTSKMLLWRCPNHDEPYPCTGQNRVLGKKCGYCRGLRVKAGVNDMATTHPQLAEELVGDPTTVLAGTNTTLQWRCPNHAEPYPATGAQRVGGVGCGYCAGKRVLVGFNDMAATHPGLAAELVGTDPTTVMAGTGKTLTWRCSRGHEYRTTGDARVRESRGCPYCANTKVLAGFNDLATTHPEVAVEMLGDPTTILAGNIRTRVRWQCSTCGNQWTATALNRTRHKSGCPSCNKGGFDQTKPGVIYLMERPGQQQFGITGSLERRLYDHAGEDWELVELSPWMPGDQAVGLELAVKRWLRTTVGTVPQSSETWVTDRLHVASLGELFERADVPWPFHGQEPAELPARTRRANRARGTRRAGRSAGSDAR